MGICVRTHAVILLITETAEEKTITNTECKSPMLDSLTNLPEQASGYVT